jgi:hypothetical protein
LDALVDPYATHHFLFFNDTRTETQTLSSSAFGMLFYPISIEQSGAACCHLADRRSFCLPIFDLRR